MWRTPTDRQRIHGELLKLGFDVSHATVSRYMPRRSYPPTQSWRTFLRSQALGIGMIGFGEAGRVSAQLLALVRGRRRVRRHQGGGWHLLQAYRATVHLAPVEAISLFQWY